MRHRVAGVEDSEILGGSSNTQLIKDEGYRNPMTTPELIDRVWKLSRGFWLEEKSTRPIFASAPKIPDHRSDQPEFVRERQPYTRRANCSFLGPAVYPQVCFLYVNPDMLGLRR